MEVADINISFMPGRRLLVNLSLKLHINCNLTFYFFEVTGPGYCQMELYRFMTWSNCSKAGMFKRPWRFMLVQQWFSIVLPKEIGTIIVSNFHDLTLKALNEC